MYVYEMLQQLPLLKYLDLEVFDAWKLSISKMKSTSFITCSWFYSWSCYNSIFKSSILYTPFQSWKLMFNFV
jgi:hypothetical protein